MIYEIQFCIRYIFAITKVRSRQRVKLPAVQPVVTRTPALGCFLGIKMKIVFIIILLSIFFIILYKKNKSLKSAKEISLNKEISKEDYDEIKNYISETYNIDIHEIYAPEKFK